MHCIEIRSSTHKIFHVQKPLLTKIFGDIGCHLKAKRFFSQNRLNFSVSLPNEHSQFFDFEERNKILATQILQICPSKEIRDQTFWAVHPI